LFKFMVYSRLQLLFYNNGLGKAKCGKAGGYSVIAIRTAWMSYYYPTIFMKANLNTYITDPKKIKLYLAYCNKSNIKLLPPSVNKSNQFFTVEGDDIRFGIKGIKNLNKSSSLIIEERKERGDFTSYYDFVDRMVKHQKLTSKTVESLIYAGALDEFPGSRNAKLSILNELMEVAKYDKTFMNSNQSTIFDLAESFGLNDFKSLKEIEVQNLEEFDKDFKLAKEEEYAGFFITEHPLEAYNFLLKEEDVKEIIEVTKVADENEVEYEEDEEDLTKEENYIGKTIKLAGIISDLQVKHSSKDGSAFNTFVLKDMTGDLNVVCFAKEKVKNEDKLIEGKKVIIIGVLDYNDFGYQLKVKTMKDLSLSKEFVESIVVTGNKNIEIARNQWRELKEYTKQNEGDVSIKFLLENKEYICPNKLNLTIETLSDIHSLFGEGNCKVNFY